MREREPAAQLSGGLVRSGPVERHGGGGASGCPGNLGSPLVESDGRHLDVILAAVDDFVEAMQVQKCYAGTNVKTNGLEWLV